MPIFAFSFRVLGVFHAQVLVESCISYLSNADPCVFVDVTLTLSEAALNRWAKFQTFLSLGPRVSNKFLPVVL
jgi:hypothetical protein